MREVYTVYYQYACKGPQRRREFTSLEEADAWIKSQGPESFKYFVAMHKEP